MPYDKQIWHDRPDTSTPLKDERLNHVEDGLAGVAATLDAMVDAVNALAAGKAAAKIEKIAGGTTAARPAPTLDAVYRDHDLGRVMYGTGSKWVTGRGVDVPGAGAANAPQNFAADVQPDNSVICSWLPVANATSYKLYEIQSPTGVAGATVLSTTTITRAPGTFRTYEYWVTAIVGSAETAPSNHALAVLPFGGGGTGIGSPAALLGLGATGGFWNAGIGYSTGHVDYTFATLSTGATFPPYFVLNTPGTAVQFQVYMNGATLDASTAFARCELRELGNDGVTKAAWTAASGTHSIEYSFKVNHLQPKRPEVIVGHLCDAAGEAVTIRVTGATASALNVVAAIYGTDQTPTLVTGYALGTTVKIKLELIDGTLRIYVNGTLKVTSTTLAGGSAPVPWVAQLYVATTGSDSNSGTLKSAPKKTIAAAISAANAGDTISVASGTYSGNVLTPKGGSSAGYITIRSEVPRGAIIVGNGSTSGQGAFEINHQYIRLRDLSITGPGGEGSGAREGVLVNADNVEVRGCNIYNLCKWQTGGTSFQGGAGIDFGGPNRTNITIDGNEIHNVGISPGNDSLVHGIYCGVHGTNFRIINNLIYGNEDFGVHPYDETESSGIQIINNTIIGNGRGILQAPNGTTRNNICYNNLSSNYLIRGSGNVLSNNFSGGTGNVTGISGVTSGVNPLFVRYATDSTGDFHLQAASPALNAGTSTGAPDHDLVGTTRPQGSAVDIGCLESVTAASGTGTGASGCYYRLGAFPQSSSTAGGFESPSEYCSVDISGLTVVHNPPLGVSVDDGTEAAKLLGWGAPIDGDEFEYTGPPVSSKWSMYDGPGHGGNGLRRPSAFNVANGILTCSGDAGGTTGGMSFYRSEKYCRIEWRVRTYSVNPTASGNRYHAVLIDWPTSDSWPQGGEYDFYECDPESGKYEAYLHIPGNDGSAQEYVSKPCDISQWHNIAFEWTSSGIKGWLDGVQVFAYAGSYIQAPGPMQFTFQLDNFFGTNMLPGKFEAKWMRIYTRPS